MIHRNETPPPLFGGLTPKFPPLRDMAQSLPDSPIGRLFDANDQNPTPRTPKAKDAPGTIVGQLVASDPNVHPADLERLTGQNADLLAWLQTGAKVTAAQAWERLRMHRLAARVWDLRRAGYDVRSERNESVKGAVYWLEGKVKT